MSTKLIDFDTKELTFLYLVLDEKRKDFQAKIETVEKFDPSEIKYDLYEFYTSQLDTCTQWMTKVNEAALFVKTQDIIKNN